MATVIAATRQAGCAGLAALAAAALWGLGYTPRRPQGGCALEGKSTAAANSTPNVNVAPNVTPDVTPGNGTGKAAAFAGRRHGAFRFGCPGGSNLKLLEGFTTSYNTQHRQPNWVCEHLHRGMLAHTATRKSCRFFEDEAVEALFRARLADYKHSGYDRGHLAASGNHSHSQKEMCSTFTLANMSPQVGAGFNRGAWLKLEEHVRKLAAAHADVYVCSGPLYLPRREADGNLYVKYRVIGDSNVSVPTHFFKAIVSVSANGSILAENYIMPNEKIPDGTPLAQFLVPLAVIERASGFRFFQRLSAGDETTLSRGSSSSSSRNSSSGGDTSFHTPNVWSQRCD